jgi:hypothetical protein
MSSFYLQKSLIRKNLYISKLIIPSPYFIFAFFSLKTYNNFQSSPAHYSSGGTAHNINHGQGGEGVVREGGGTSAGGFGRQQQQGGGAPQGTWR